MEKLVILDGHSLMNRAFYAVPELMTTDGIYTNAIYGFMNMLYKIKEDINPDFVVTTFDRKAPTFRHTEYKDYKAGRKKMPKELHMQFEPLKEILRKSAINIFEIDGFEADDLIGTLAVHAEKDGMEVYIITGDKDALQLASENIKVVFTKRGVTETEIYDSKRMIDELLVTPTEFIDVKALMGDKSDNIPGVAGIGEKTAYKLITQYKSIESLYDNLDDIKGKMREKLELGREDAFFSKMLSTIKTDVPIDIDLDSIKSKTLYDEDGLRELYKKYQLKSFLSKLPKENTKREVVEIDKTFINTLEAYEEFLKEIEGMDKKEAFIIYEALNKEKYSKISLKDIYIHFSGNKAYYLNIEDFQNEKILDKVLKKIFQGDFKKIIHQGKNLYTILSKNNIDIKTIEFDSEIAAYLIESFRKSYDLDGLLEDFIDVKAEDGFEKVYHLKELYKVLNDKIIELNMEKLLKDIELPLTKLLSLMECSGFKVDKEMLSLLKETFKKEISESEKEIYKLSGEEFNISSPKQLGKILFEKLDLPVIKKTKTGYSTNVDVLDKLRDKHPIINKITHYRQLTKLNSTYIEGLLNVIDEDEKIHSSFNQTVTTTGRLSSTEPNLQNIPIKYELGRAIRKVFVPNNEDCILLSADYSQIELRVLAHICEDENLIEAFTHHDDIHRKTASEVFNTPMDKVTKEQRSAAKAVNFGIVYGISDFALSEDLNISRKEAKSYIDMYFDRYPKVKEFINNSIEYGKKNLYVTTIFNRRRFIPEISSSNKIVKSFGERLAMNAPIQGTAADIIKLAMVNLEKRLEEKGVKSTIILQVHDEIILNVYKDEIDVIKKIVKEEMENVITFKVPLDVDINTGDNWYDTK